MCNAWCLSFVKKSIRYWPKLAHVLEGGSLNVNGSPRDVARMNVDYFTWLGLDLQSGPGVDVVSDVTRLDFSGSFDVVISTEMLEHVEDWQLALSNLWRALRVGGILVLTTRSPGFPYHGFPADCWRFTIAGLLPVFRHSGRLLFAEKDTRTPGLGLCLCKTGIIGLDFSVADVQTAPQQLAKDPAAQ